MGKTRRLSFLLLLALVILGVTSGQEEGQEESERQERDVSSQRFGTKLKQRRPKKLEVELELPLPDPQGEEPEVPSSTLPPIRTGRGRVPSKIMVRTHLTTTTTPNYEEVGVDVGVGSFLQYYQNPYVSRKPSIPPKKYVLKKAPKGEEQERAFSFPDFPRTTPEVTTTTTTEAYHHHHHHQSESEPETPVYEAQYQAQESRESGESRALARTLQTPVPERPLNRGKVSNSLKTVEAPKRRVIHAPVTTRRVVATTTTTTEAPTEVIQEQYETTYEPRQQEVSGNSEEYQGQTEPEVEVETTSYTATTSTSQAPTTTTTERSFLRTTGQRSTPASATSRRHSQQPTVKTRTSVAVEKLSTSTTPVPPRDLSPPKTGIPLKVKTITFKPIYRSLSDPDTAGQDQEEKDPKPELELLRKERAKEAETVTGRKVAEASTEGEDPMDAARFWEASVTQESTVAPETEVTTTTAATTELDPVAAAKYWANSATEKTEAEEPENKGPEPPSTTTTAKTTETPQKTPELKPKVHYLVTVIGTGENATEGGAPSIPAEALQRFVESGGEDGEGFPFTLAQLKQGQQVVEEGQPQVVKLSAEPEVEVKGQSQEEEAVISGDQGPKYEVVQLPKEDAPPVEAPSAPPTEASSSSSSGRETIFHFSSNDPLPEPKVQLRNKFGNFIVEDHSPNSFRQGQGGRAFDWRPIPLRTVVNFEPEPTKEDEGAALFTGKSVAYFSHVAEDGRITKQLRSSQGPRTLEDLITNIQASRTGGFDPYLEQQRQRERELRYQQQQQVFSSGSFFRTQRDLIGSGGDLNLRAVPAQSFYLGERREEEEEREGGGVRALRDVPYTVQYVSQ